MTKICLLSSHDTYTRKSAKVHFKEQSCFRYCCLFSFISLFFCCCCCFFSIWVFFHNHSRITELQGKGEGVYLTPHYHFHQLHRHLDVSRAITTDSSPLHIGSSCTRTGTFGFRAQVTNH